MTIKEEKKHSKFKSKHLELSQEENITVLMGMQSLWSSELKSQAITQYGNEKWNNKKGKY